MTILPVVYIAGPHRGQHAWAIEQNIRHAEAVALDVWRVGGAALCPHANARFFQGVLDDQVWLEGGLSLLRKCDAILMTVFWERSKSAKAEHALAKAERIPIFYDIPTLKEWIDGRS